MCILRQFRCFTSKLAKNSSMIPKMKIEDMMSIISCEDEEASVKAAEYLRMGHVIAVPTDTIYGLACSANSKTAIKKLYSIKGRDSAKPVAICVSEISDVRKWGKADHLQDELLQQLLPGPVTIVLERTPLLDNPYLNPMTTKIGIRIPKHDFINNVSKLLNLPVALTSANSSNEPSSLCIKEFEHLFNKLGAVFDGGLLHKGLDKNRSGSTVIDLSVKGQYNIIRKGISYDSIVNLLEQNGISRALKHVN